MTAQGPYYPLPWSVKIKDAVQVYDANGECVLMFYWPAHPVDKEAEAVKAVEDAAREMVRLMNVSPAAYADGHASGVQTERKRIVAWLRKEADTFEDHAHAGISIKRLAAELEGAEG